VRTLRAAQGTTTLEGNGFPQANHEAIASLHGPPDSSHLEIQVLPWELLQATGQLPVPHAPLAHGDEADDEPFDP
jgi:hypothetical protein